MSRLPAPLLDELDLRDGHTALDRLHHVVDGERRHRGGRERFHLDAGLVHGAHARLYGQLAALHVVAEGDVETGDAQRVTERDQLRRALGGQDARGTRDAEYTGLGRVPLPDDTEGVGVNAKNRAGESSARRL